MSTAYLAAKPNRSAGRQARVRIVVDAPRRYTRPQARVLVRYRDGTLAARVVSLDSAGNGSVKVDFGRGTVRQVSVALVNASDRFRLATCGSRSTSYSCHGARPRDDNRTYWVKVSLT